jgi:hypothetical protein
VYGAIHESNPDTPLLTIKYLEALTAMADGRATKIVVPPSWRASPDRSRPWPDLAQQRHRREQNRTREGHSPTLTHPPSPNESLTDHRPPPTTAVPVHPANPANYPDHS